MLAIGATVRRDLPAPGRELSGIHQAMEFLPQANRVALGEEVEDQILATDKDVVIIGGGDTGADCLGTVIRQGARSVTSLEIMPQPGEDRPENQPWPMYPMIFRTASAHEEGGERVYSVSTKEFVGEDGQLTGLRISEVEMKDGSFVDVPGSERTIPAQLVLFAMGFTGPEQEGPRRAARGRSRRARATSCATRTTCPASTACSSPVTPDAGSRSSSGPSPRAARAAAGVDAFLSGSTNLPSPIPPTARSLAV